MPRRRTRNLIRALVGAALCSGLIIFVAAPVPEDLPTVALRQPGLYRLELALISFYSGLLLVTPAISGLIDGRLPIEISTRGARFAEEANGTAKEEEEAIRALEATTSELAQALTDAQAEIERLNGLTNEDSTQREVNSKR